MNNYLLGSTYPISFEQLIYCDYILVFIRLSNISMYEKKLWKFTLMQYAKSEYYIFVLKSYWLYFNYFRKLYQKKINLILWI